jgi:hypothetical protein
MKVGGLQHVRTTTQYRGIHDFVAALSIPNALLNYAGDQPFERYNAAPTTQLSLIREVSICALTWCAAGDMQADVQPDIRERYTFPRVKA